MACWNGSTGRPRVQCSRAAGLRETSALPSCGVDSRTSQSRRCRPDSRAHRCREARRRSKRMLKIPPGPYHRARRGLPAGGCPTGVPAGGARRGLPDGGRTKVAEATTVRRLATHHLVSEYCRWWCWPCGQSSQPISDATNGVDLRRQAPGGLENVTAGSMPTASVHRLGGFAAISRGLSEGRSVSRNPERGNATPRREQNRASGRRDAPCR